MGRKPYGKQKQVKLQEDKNSIKLRLSDGSEVQQTKLTAFLPDHRRTYPQNWPAYNTAQLNEERNFGRLLADLCSLIREPEYEFGRPIIPYRDIVYSLATKVYSTKCYRVAWGQLESPLKTGYIDSCPSFSQLATCMRDPRLTPVIDRLIRISSLPLATVESVFGVDATGFGTSRFSRYFSYKHGKDMTHRTWVKANAICGVKTKVVTAVILTEENRGDVRYFQPLVEETMKRFQVDEILADKAYSSRNCYNLAASLGFEAYIPFRKNATGKSLGSSQWRKAFDYFMLHRDDFLRHYHMRSNVETAFHMIKAKFGGSIRSKDMTAQFNEVLLKILCHNICVVNHAFYELGILPTFDMQNIDF